jgi:gluconokinase
LILVVMGVSGCGKTTIGTALANSLGWQFVEGDSFHPPANVEKMRSGQPLDDSDRWPWLDRISAAIAQWNRAGHNVVLSCSALKQAYRERLAGAGSGVQFIYLKGTQAVIAERIAMRRHQYMPPSLLPSQLATLEEPREAIVVDIGQSPESIVARILARLGRTG